jgi:hypothetical protein
VSAQYYWCQTHTAVERKSHLDGCALVGPTDSPEEALKIGFSRGEVPIRLSGPEKIVLIWIPGHGGEVIDPKDGKVAWMAWQETELDYRPILRALRLLESKGIISKASGTSQGTTQVKLLIAKRQARRLLS